MQKKNRHCLNLQRLRRAAWLPLVTLAWLQLTLASHQFDHVAEYFSESCHVCVQLDRADDAAFDHDPADTTVRHALTQPHAILTQTVARPPLRHFDSRAPPTL